MEGAPSIRALMEPAQKTSEAPRIEFTKCGATASHAGPSASDSMPTGLPTEMPPGVPTVGGDSDIKSNEVDETSRTLSGRGETQSVALSIRWGASFFWTDCLGLRMIGNGDGLFFHKYRGLIDEFMTSCFPASIHSLCRVARQLC